MDYAKLRAAALRDGEDEEAVTVDTRALIDKVLARYSGEWTTLRELIQNAADAQATTVKIKWETLPSTSVPLPSATSPSEMLKHTLSHHTLRRLVVQNNGQPFTKTDWGRLKRIAEGNPDETKIGAFGVGFYSVFADCEEPFVSSGSEAMAFYWKGNALFTRKLQVPQEQGGSSDTAFVLDYRNTTTPVPNLLSVGQFLATSLTFVALQNIEFWIDDWKVLALQKKTSRSAEIAIPRALITTTTERLMKLTSAERTNAQIDATFMSVLGWKPQAVSSSNRSNDQYYNGAGSEAPSLRAFFNKLTSATTQVGLRGKEAQEEKAIQDAIAEDVTATSTSSIFLRVTSAQIQTRVQAQFAAELERATKKPPPKTTKIAILTSSYDETVASEQSSTYSQAAKAADVFSSVLPSKKPGGRIFIGFPTTQTTGAGMHISAPSVIPTVEREAIDLNANYVRKWNIEMLRVAGIMSRLAYTNEMSDLDEKLRRRAKANEGSKLSPGDVQALLPEAVHILKTYTFGDSTPSGQVAQIMNDAFWRCYPDAVIEVYSSRGVLPSTKVRSSSEEIAKFVTGIPVMLPEMKDLPFVKKLHDVGVIREISVDDIHAELVATAMDKDQVRHFIAWAARSATSGEIDPPSTRKLLNAAVAAISEGGDSGSIIALSSITNYQSSRIPTTLPIPPTTLPPSLIGDTPEAMLKRLGWEPLSLPAWLKFLIDSGPSRADEENITKSAEFSLRVLHVLSKNWDNIGGNAQLDIALALRNITAIPTKMGMRKPGESFFATVKLFDDLPTLEPGVNLKEKFLVLLGVRKTVDLDTIFTRLLNPSPAGIESEQKRWNHMKVIKYLASVKDDIPAAEMAKLQKSKLCPAEAGPPGLEPTKGSAELYKVSELYQPKDELRELKLPILHWPGPPGSFRANGPEGKFLASLGLRAYPPVHELVSIMTSSDAALRRSAMTYFINYHQTNGYGRVDLSGTDKAILPLQGKGERLVTPSACYTNERAAVLGYDILANELHIHANKFGVARDPPILGCVERLMAAPPKDRQTAITLFEYFQSRLSDLQQQHIAKLGQAPIIPVQRVQDNSSRTTLVHLQPQNCYLGSSSTYENIFDFVDFGNDANTFLYRCGAKVQPTKTEIAQLMCGEPARLLGTLQSPEKYLELIRSLTEDLAVLKKNRELFKKMRTSPWLLGFKEISIKENEDADPIRQYELAAPSQIVIQDDLICYRIFKQSLICAPEDDALEAFYMALGCETLGSKVQEDIRVGAHAEKQDGAKWLRQHVLERSKLFIYEYSKYKPDSIRHDEKWLEKNLQVVAVKSLSLRRSLTGHNQSHLEKRSAASTYAQGSWILYVASEGRPDMYQVGQAICQLLLDRPKQQAYFFFEPFLKLDLLDLRSRGYNVDRILRAKAAEARIAEEERRKALEAEQQKIKEREQEWMRHTRETEVAAAAAKTPEPKTRMPGSFADSPEDEKEPVDLPNRNKNKGRGLFSQLSRRLGFESDDEEAKKQKDKILMPPPLAPPPQCAPTTRPVSAGQAKKPQAEEDRVTSPAVVQQNLLNAITSTRAYDSSHLFSPPTTNEVKEQATYCDETTSKNIVFAADAPGGMRVFVARDLSISAADFLGQNYEAIAQFEGVLKDASEIYGLSAKAMHIFYDEAGGAIAFNSNGSIFCNLRFFNQLHADRLKRPTTPTGIAAAAAGAWKQQARVEATTWWWVVIAHELAHNLVHPHNSEHSYYTESFIQQYFGKMMAKAGSWASASRATVAAHAADARRGAGDATNAPQGGIPPPPPYRAVPGPSSLLD
ncbi:heat shock cognate 90 kDa protein [Rhypophila decipiens]|uniref:Heat shock cognate 90 kDa protein n=1 Tax=Rhypophila decipiens TaxID=261697 RepID=A0AAN6YFC8_9PEZI|nr:heat shock cognate 90 kDa protein [Rhypophila decipiens]